MEDFINLKAVIASIIFSAIGLAILASGLFIFDRITPGHLWKEIIDEHNVALAIIVGAIAIGTSIIIGCAIHG